MHLCMHSLHAPILISSVFADFYTPPVIADAMTVIKQLAGVKALPFGGYSQAERARLILGQEDVINAFQADPQQVSCKASHPV